MNNLIAILQFIFLGLMPRLSNQQTNTNIIHVTIVNYHGSRAPLWSYPTDPYGESYWARYGGLGQITPKGLLQSYNLGQYVKNYYSSYLTPSYSPQRVSATSVDSDPALVSTSAFLAGMFPPSNSDQLWSPTVSWFPIPVHPAESIYNPIVKNVCPKHKQLVKESMNSEGFQETESQYMDLVTNISGFTASPSLNFNNLSHVFDNAYAKLSSNLPLELWLSEHLKNLTDANNKLLELKYGTIEKSRLIAGGILLDIIKNIRDKMNETQNEIQVYSFLDFHLISLFKLLDLNINMTYIPFGTSLIFELRKDTNDLHYINIMLKTNNVSEPTSINPVKMNDCSQLCNFGNFFDILIRRTMIDVTKECSWDESGPMATTDSIFNTNFYSTPCPTVNEMNMTSFTEDQIRDKDNAIMELNRLEISLIITVSILSLIVFALLISFGLYAYKNKVFKVSF